MSVNTKIAEMAKKVGRPAGRKQDRPFQMRVTDELLARVDDWRRMQADMPSRSEAIRRIVEQATIEPKKRR
jgi:metal-responsive CopG/Arc/MetJ family transcriptional regulator